MARALLVLLAAAAGGHAAVVPWMNAADGVANPAAVVFPVPQVRVSVLTGGVVRMEYAASGEAGAFDDDATLAFVKRRFDTPPPFTTVTSPDGATVTLTTPTAVLTFDTAAAAIGLGQPGAVTARLTVAPYSTWTPAAAPTGNLHGTIRTLDRVNDPLNLACPPVTTLYVYYSHCEEGVVSRDGWVLIDDTMRPRIPRGSGWPAAPHGGGTRADGTYLDWVLFTHGHDYKAALRDFTALSGPIPLAPRYALGPAFSRWYQWNDLENTEIVQSGFADNGIPLDVLVVDMDWHYTYPRGLPNPHDVRVEGWTGHTVYPYLFPEPAHFLAYLRRRNVMVTFNHHPAAGIEFHERVYADFARALGQDPATGATLAFDISNATWADAYFKHVIQPIDDLGMQYWWLDYQQEPFTPVPFLNPTILCNLAWYTNSHRYGEHAPPAKRDDRPYVMGRFGGLGAHRYPIGFVGDTYVRWEVLRFETYFMPTASNVAFQWTHDIGGFEGTSPAEFFTRHLQFGTFSPALRTHSSKRSTARSIWTYPQPYFGVMKRFYRLRTRLVPYIAAAQRVAYDSGLPVVRPMYYEFPEADAAYTDQGLHQYFFGDDLWVAPIAAPGGGNSSTRRTAFNLSGVATTPWTVWVPPGTWIEWFSWEAVTAPAPGGGFMARTYGIGEMPLFGRPGAIIPMRALEADASVLGVSSTVPRALTLTVLPGVVVPRGESVTRSARIYDDDGATMRYADGVYAWTNVSCTWSAPQERTAAASVRCTVSPPEGNLAALRGVLPTTRTYTWRMVGSWPPASVAVNGVPVAHDAAGAPDAHGENPGWLPGANAWSYEGTTLSTWVHVGVRQSLDTPTVIDLTYAPGLHTDDARLTAGLTRKLARALACKDDIDRLYGALFTSDVESLLNVTATPSRLAAAPDGVAAAAALAAVPGYLSTATAQMELWRIPATHLAKPAHARCLAALADAATPATLLPATDPRAVAANGPITWKHEVGPHMTAPVPEVSEMNVGAYP